MDTAYERSLWILQQNPENEPGLAPRAVKGIVLADSLNLPPPKAIESLRFWSNKLQETLIQNDLKTPEMESIGEL